MKEFTPLLNISTVLESLDHTKGIGPKKKRVICKAIERFSFSNTLGKINIFDLLKIKTIGPKIFNNLAHSIYTNDDPITLVVVVSQILTSLSIKEGQGSNYMTVSELLKDVAELSQYIEEKDLRAYLRWAHKQNLIDYSSTSEIITKNGHLSRCYRGLKTLESLAHSGRTLPPDFKNPKISQDDLSGEQLVALEHSLRPGLNFIAAGPGSGKTHLISKIVGNALKISTSILIIAPTKLAVKNIKERSGILPTTLQGFLKNREDFEDYQFDFIVIDESSLVDESAFLTILNYTHQNTSLIMVGDPYQNSSVLPGRTFYELLVHHKDLNIFLKKNFRMTNAQSGKLCEYLRQAPSFSKKDIWRITNNNPSFKASLKWIGVYHQEQITMNIINVAVNNPNKDYLVVSPKNTGTYGVLELQKVISESGVSNITVSTPAKSQGLQFDGVFILLMRSHQFLIKRESVYTAATRSRDNIWILSDTSYIRFYQQKRNGLLGHLLGQN